LQRAYDEILHDVCIEKLPVVFAIDRAGLVGSDGETHQGIFDISYLSSIPHMTVLAPKNKWELSDMMKFAVDYGAPIAVRFPRGEAYDGLKEFRAPIEAGKCEWIKKGQQVALFALGSMVKTAEQVAELLEEKGIHCSIINARFVQPFDKECIRSLAEDHTLLVTMEENVISGGMGEHIAAFLAQERIPLAIQIAAIPNDFVEQGNVNKLKEVLRIDAQSIFEKIWKEVI
jgi:1-deoxy-D-xylulose-5-phosphate synthase